MKKIRTAALLVAAGAMVAMAGAGTAYGDQWWVAAAYSAKTGGIDIQESNDQGTAIHAALTGCNSDHRTNDCVVAVTSQQCVAAVLADNNKWAGGTGTTRQAAINDAARIAGSSVSAGNFLARCAGDPQQ